MSGKGFYKKTDKAYTQNNVNDAQPIGEEVLIRRVSGKTAGNPIEGEQPTLVYKTKKTKAIISRGTPEEITASAGIYQYGDLIAQMLEDLKFTDERTGDIGDRVIYQKQTYRVVGRTQNQAIEGRNMYYSYILRKVGNA